MVGCLGLLLVGIAELESKHRHYSSREVGWKRSGAVGCKDCRGPAVGVKTVEDQLFSPPSSSPSSFLVSLHSLAELLAVALQVEVRLGSWRLHRMSLGNWCSAGVEVRDWEPGVKCDLGGETVSPGGTLENAPCILLPRSQWVCSYFKRGSAHFNIYLF